MKLADAQAHFMALLLDDGHQLPSGWGDHMGAGLDVYRNAYRGRLVDALRATFPRTAQWVGEDAFRAAAAHYLITHPPQGWTLDAIGAGFPEVLAELFAQDCEVSELAWLEWAMHSTFTAADDAPMTVAAIGPATAHFAEADWAAMRLRCVSSLQMHTVISNCAALWQSLGAGDGAEVAFLDNPQYCIVWRDGLAPVFRLIDAQQGHCLSRMAAGASFGEICDHLASASEPQSAATRAGEMLAGWFALGLVGGLDGPASTSQK